MTVHLKYPYTANQTGGQSASLQPPWPHLADRMDTVTTAGSSSGSGDDDTEGGNGKMSWPQTEREKRRSSSEAGEAPHD